MAAGPASSSSNHRQQTSSSSPRISTTTPLEHGAIDPARWADVPPMAVDAPPAEPKPGERTPEENAAAFAGMVAMLASLAMTDARKFYSDELAALPFPVDDQVQEKAVAVIAASAHRVAVKYGFSFSLPFQDELVTAGAGVGSILYLWARKTGRLDRDHSDRPAGAANRPPDSASPAPAGDVDDEPEGELWNRATAPSNQNELSQLIKGIPGH